MGKPPKSYQVTEWGWRGELIQTQWGNIRYEQYIQKEIERWYDRDCTPAWIEVEEETDCIAMFTEWDDRFLTPDDEP